MKRLIFLTAIAVLALASGTGAAEISQYSITFDMQPSGQVNESLHVVFAQPVAEDYYSYMFAGGISGLMISDGSEPVQYSVDSDGTESRVRILVPAGTKEIFINFHTSDLVFWNGNVMQFFTNFQPPAGLSSANIRVILPQGFSVYRDMCSPEPMKSTDGARIFLDWSIQNPGENVPISVKISGPNQDFLLPAGIGIAAAAGFIWFFIRYRKGTQHAFLRGFTEDESSVIKCLKSRKVCYQNALVRELGFSKAKMSRITQKLEKRGLISREKTGKNKRIEWKG